MTIKNKLRAGFGFLFLTAFVCIGLSIYYLNRLSADSSVVLKDNYQTLHYMRNIGATLDENTGRLDSSQIKLIDANLEKQERNITERGEQQLTDSLRSEYERLKLLDPGGRGRYFLRSRISKSLFGIMQLNMAAIERKNAIARETAKSATLLVAFISALLFVIAFTFITNYPGYIANPIKELTERIKAISRRNYDQQLNIKSDDEFGELAQAFNDMTFKLNEFENSNLASILFEKKRIETVINSMKDAIIGLDEKGIVIFINDVACTLIGMPSNYLVGKYAPDIAVENDLFRNLLSSDKSRIKIFADNRESYYSKELLSVNTAEKLIGNVIVLNNITEFQQLDEAKTNFIATISHELKTPISSIKMSLSLLQNKRIGELNSEQMQLLENIDDDARRLLQITGELLDTAQVETGRLKLNFGSTHPRNIVDYAVKAVNLTAEQKAVRLHVICSDGLPQVRADLDKTAWVLVNLLSNAVKYSPGGSDVQLTVLENKDGEIEFSVSDQGPGIESQYLPRIFERYFKVPGLKSDHSGTGLGLAIAKDFIEAQSGKIGVQSEPGLGSRFYFTLKKTDGSSLREGV